MPFLIGEKIRLLRTLKGYSQEGLAITAGLKQENISYIENNRSKKEIKSEIISRIAEALDVKAEDLKYSSISALIEKIQ